MQDKRIQYLTRLAVFVAVTLVMAYTPLGYLRTPGLEITFLMIPVTVGAIVLGPAAGAILGGVFGLTSFFQCLDGSSWFGATLLSINPVSTCILCLVPRILAGLLPGLLFSALGRRRGLGFCAAAALLDPVMNTVLFVGGLGLLFFHTDFIQEMAAGAPFLAFCVAFVGVQGVVEAAACCLISTPVAKALLHVNWSLGRRTA